jgi:hypothetical protein
MSNYIHSNNQQLLWKAVNQIPAFSQLNPPKKDFEFKQVVEYFYHKNAHKMILSLPELQQLNRDTISAFIPKKPPLVPTQSKSIMSERPSFVETKQEKSQRQFQERQFEYEQMNVKPELPSPDIFLEKGNDEQTIQNMDELILQYQKQREMDLVPFDIQPPIIPPNVPKVPKKLNILDSTVFPEKEVYDLDNKKSVSWSNTLTVENDPDPYPDVDIPLKWREKIESLERNMKALEKKIESLERKEVEVIPPQTNEPIDIVSSTLDHMISKIENINNIKNKLLLI